jgi:hypothetical protein
MSAPAPPVLLIDDGELVSVRQLLEELGADFEAIATKDAARSFTQPTRLLVMTARAAHALRIERTLTPAPHRAAWMAFVNGDSKTQRLALQKAGFDFLIREPVHPTALRVLFHRALFRGSDTRKVPRVACGYPVRYRTGLWPRSAMLVDLSPRGCRLLVDKPIAEKAELCIAIASELAGGKTLRLRGHAVRVSPASREGGVAALLSVGVRFAALDDKTRSRLRDVLTERMIGPAALEAAIPFTPAESRPSDGQPSPGEKVKGRRRRVNARRPYRKQVHAVDGTDSYMILCLDLSVGGMRIEPIEGLGLDSKLALAVQLSAREEPVLVEATVVRDDGEQGLALRFDWMAPESRRKIERLVDTLPAIQGLQPDTKKQGTILAQRVSRPHRDDR